MADLHLSLPETDIQHTENFKDAFARFAAKVRIAESGCWEWTGTKSGIGYGQFILDGRRGFRKSTSPHRFAYMWYVGAIPEDKEIDHLCRNRGCCNPAHLEIVTHQENMRRMSEAITRCVNGHPQIFANGKKRRCKECNRETQERWRQTYGVSRWYPGIKKIA